MKEYTITYDNRQDLDSLYFHDCCFEGFIYNYEAHRITMQFTRRGYMDTVFKLTFNSVVYFTMQGCESWGPCQRIYEMWADNTLTELSKLYSDHFIIPDRLEEKLISFIDAGRKKAPALLPVALQIISGDTLLIICESIDITEYPQPENSVATQ